MFYYHGNNNTSAPTLKSQTHMVDELAINQITKEDIDDDDELDPITYTNLKQHKSSNLDVVLTATNSCSSNLRAESSNAVVDYNNR